MQDMNEVCRVEHQAPGYTFLHDFALTPTHYVLVQNPVGLQPVNFLLGKVSAAASVKWLDGKPAEIHHLGRPLVDAPGSSPSAAVRNKQLPENGSSQGAVGVKYGHAANDRVSGGQQQQQQQNGSSGSAVAERRNHAQLGGLPDGAQQQQQQQQKKKKRHHRQQQDASSSRHQPEHLISEVGLLGGALNLAQGLACQTVIAVNCLSENT